MNKRIKSKLKLQNLRVFISAALTFLTPALFSQISYTFTSAGATGVSGPSQTQVNNSYSATTLNGAVSVTGGIQSWTVPATGNYRVEANGAKGGTASSYAGGLGARMSGDFFLNNGDVIKVLVGQPGGNGGTGSYYMGGGGGGGSFVLLNSTLILAAGGGGGAGTGDTGLNGFNGNPGVTTTTGNICNGTNGQTNGTPGSSGSGGTAGNWYAAAGGGGYSGNGSNATSGTTSYGGFSFLNAGTGGAGGYFSPTYGGSGGFGGGGGAVFGGAGGGGYSGGAGGTHGGNYNATGGGGGGSYNTGSSQTNSAGVNNGNGYVVITRQAFITFTQTAFINCFGQSGAALSATASGGTPPYTYSWSPSGATTSTLGGLSAGSYTCRATDAASIEIIGVFTVGQPAVISPIIYSQSNVTCFGGSNGAVTIVATGGTAPYTYTWYPTGGTSATATGLAPGAYSVAIKDLNNCNTSITTTITQPSPLSVLAFATNPVICNGANSTLIGAGALTYTWTGGAVNGVAFSPSVTSNYTVTGTSAQGCTGTAVTSITVNPSPTVTVAGPSSVCPGVTSSISASGANSYSWNTGSTSSLITVSPSSTTNYTVTGTGGNGCPTSVVKALFVFTPPTISTSASNTVVCSGSPVIFNATGAIGYSWSGGIANGVSFSPTVTTTYTVTGTDANGCTNTATRTILVNNLPNVAVSGPTAICTGSTTVLQASGATTYTWSTGANTNTISVSPLSTTIYSVTGTDANGCKNTAIQPLVLNPLPAVTANTTNSAVCEGVPTTLIGNGASTYTWQPGNTVNQFITVSGSVSTTYTLTGTNSNGCVNSNTILITILPAPPLVVSGPTAICAGSPATLNAAGASTYTWNTGANGAAITVSPSTSTVYSVVAEGANGCLKGASKTVLVDPIPNVTASSGSPAVCNGSPATLIGNGALNYSWLPGNATTQLLTVSPNSTTTYTLTGTNQNGCSGTGTITITVLALPTITITGPGAICIGSSGTLTAAGGTAYTWNNGSSVAGITISPTLNTTYSVTAIGANGCAGTAVKNVVVNPLPTISISGTSLTCAGYATNLTGNGGLTYTWSTAATGSVAVVYPAANTVYSVTGTDANGCNGTATHSISVNPSPTVSAVTSASLICAGETATLTVSGGITYTWSTAEDSISIVVTPSVTTPYSVTVSGTNGCQNTAIITQSVSDCVGVKDVNTNNSLLVYPNVGSSRVDLQACKLEYSIVSPK